MEERLSVTAGETELGQVCVNSVLLLFSLKISQRKEIHRKKTKTERKREEEKMMGRGWKKRI